MTGKCSVPPELISTIMRLLFGAEQDKEPDLSKAAFPLNTGASIAAKVERKVCGPASSGIVPYFHEMCTSFTAAEKRLPAHLAKLLTAREMSLAGREWLETLRDDIEQIVRASRYSMSFLIGRPDVEVECPISKGASPITIATNLAQFAHKLERELIPPLDRLIAQPA